MAFENKSAAHAVSGSVGGRAEEDSQSLISALSVHETGRRVKSGPCGGLGYAQARRLAGMLTPRQQRDVLLLALAIQGTEV